MIRLEDLYSWDTEQWTHVYWRTSKAGNVEVLVSFPVQFNTEEFSSVVSTSTGVPQSRMATVGPKSLSQLRFVAYASGSISSMISRIISVGY
jgi:hypothetical protein